MKNAVKSVIIAAALSSFVASAHAGILTMLVAGAAGSCLASPTCKAKISGGANAAATSNGVQQPVSGWRAYVATSIAKARGGAPSAAAPRQNYGAGQAAGSSLSSALRGY